MKNLLKVDTPLTVSLFLLCIFSSNFFHAQTPLVIGIPSIHHVTCFGGNDGSATASAMGGVPPYKFEWSNGQTGPMATNLSAGTYFVTVEDLQMVTATNMVIITEPPEVHLSLESLSHIDCNNQFGVATVNGSGGVMPYQYIWSNGEQGHTASSLTAGPHTVSIYDSNECEKTLMVNVQDNSQPPIINIPPPLPLTCDRLTVTINASMSSNGPQFSYFWSTNNGNIVSGQGTLMIVTDTPGLYTLQITNNNTGCVAQQNVVVNQLNDPPLAIIEDPDILTCDIESVELDGSDSSAGPAFNYLWDSGDGNIVSGQGTPQIIVDEPATYSLTVLNVNTGCSASNSVIVEADLEAPIANAGDDQSICLSDTLHLMGSGGDMQYWEFENSVWIDGPCIAEPADVLGAGEHIFTFVAENENGCVGTDEVIVVINPGPEADGGEDQTLCISDTLHLMGAGGDSQYWSYENSVWMDGPCIADPAEAFESGEHIFTFVAEDENGCVDTDEVIVTVNPAPVLNIEFIGDNTISCENPKVLVETFSQEEVVQCSFTNSNGEVLDFQNCQGGIFVVPPGSGGTPTGPSQIIYSASSVETGCIGSDTAYIEDIRDPFPYEIHTQDVPHGEIRGQVNFIYDNSYSGSPWEVTYIDYKFAFDTSFVSTDEETVEILATPSFYGITGTSENGCKYYDWAVINPPDCDLTGQITTTPVSELGAKDGTLTLYASNPAGETEFWFEFDPDNPNDFVEIENYQSGTVVTGLNPTTNAVYGGGGMGVAHIMDENGCSYADNFIIGGPGIDICTTDVDCHGESTGTVMIQFVNDGEQNPTYHLLAPNGETLEEPSLNGSNFMLFDELVAGKYLALSQYDALFSFSDTAYFTIHEPPPVKIMVDGPSTITCDNPSVTLKVEGGQTGEEIIEWRDIDGNLLSNETSFTADTFMMSQEIVVILYVENIETGCISNDTTLIDVNTESPTLELSSNAGELTCENQEVVLMAVVGADDILEGGQYGIQVVDSTNVNIIIDSAGTYTLVVRDTLSGCTREEIIEITENKVAPVADAGPDVSFCLNETIDLTGSGGDNHFWSHGNIIWTDFPGSDPADTLKVLGPGAHLVTYTAVNDNGCIDTDDVVITLLEAPIVYAVSDTTFCENEVLHLMGTGGDSQYWVYENSVWIDGPCIADSASIFGVGEHVFQYVAENDNGCLESDEVQVTIRGVLPQNLSISEPLCFDGSDGSLSWEGPALLDGYEWETTATIHTVNGLTAGDYQLVFTDSTGLCETNVNAIIGGPDPFLLEIQHEYDNASDNFIVWAIASGGVSPYQFIWTDLEGNIIGQGSMISEIPCGAYLLNFTDGNGCTKLVEFELLNIDAELVISDAPCPDGFGSAFWDGAILDYTFQWSTGESGPGIFGLPSNDCLLSGSYSVTIQHDNSGCRLTQQFEIGTEITNPYTYESIDVKTGETHGEIVIYPESDQNYTIWITAPNGNYDTTFVLGDSPTTLSVLPGVYYMEGSNEDGCIYENIAVVNEETCDIEVEIQSSPSTCLGSFDGTLQVFYSNAVEPVTLTMYISEDNFQDTFNIQDYKSGDLISGLPPFGTPGIGAICCICYLEDANGCSIQYTAMDPCGNVAGPSPQIFTDWNGCHGDNSGVASVYVSNIDQSSLSYLWSTGETTRSLKDLPGGQYFVEVSDTSGCSEVLYLTVEEPAPISVPEPSVTNTSCPGICDGSISFGNLENHTFLWSTGAETPSISNLCPGDYSVVVTDTTSGCDLSFDTTIIVGGIAPNDILPDGNQYYICAPGFLLEIAANPNYQNYSWSNGDTTATALFDTPGTYEITVVNSSGCQGTATLNLLLWFLNPAPIVIDETCFEDCDGTAVLQNPPPSALIEWSNGETGANIIDLCGGQYSVNIQDTSSVNNSGCSIDTTFAVIPGLPIEFEIEQNEDTLLVAELVGGSPPYQFEWSNGSTEYYAVIEESGEYSVTIVDEKGCTSEEEIVVTSSKELEDELSFNIFPNPVSTELNIDLKNNFAKILSVQISNITGRIIWQHNEKVNQIDVKTLLPGIYYLRILAEEQIGVLPFVINR